jgi:hypothetical protein
LFASVLQPNAKGKPQPVSSQAIGIRDGASLLETVRSLDSHPRHNVHAIEVGDAMGYHSEVRCEGALLADVLAAAKAPSGPDVGYVVTEVDGYRMSVSRAELFSTVQPPPILIVDRCNGQPLGEQGAFKAIVANDTIAERWVNSVSSINIVHAAARDKH